MKLNIVSKILTNGFTSNGCRLISKETKTIFGLKKAIPKNSASVNIAKVETNFGKGVTTIKSYYDKNGNLLGKNIKNKIGNIIKSEKTITYKGTKDIVREVTTVTKSNGKITEKTYSEYNVLKNNDTGKLKMYRQKAIDKPLSSNIQEET